MRRAFLLCAILALPAPSVAVLTYVLSDTGLEPPQWESGRSEITIADVNGDGHPDVLTLGDHGNPLIGTQEHGLMTWFGNGAGQWTYARWGEFGYGGVDVGDLNGDGLADVGYAMHHNYGGDDAGDQLIETSLGNGTGLSYTPWDDGLATHGETYGMFGVVFADVDVDGRLDIAVNSFGCCNGVVVYRNNGDGTWSFLFGTGSGNSTEDIAAGDVNNDGYPDLATAVQAGTVWLNDGTGRFTRADANLPSGGNLGHEGVALGDVTGDGADDLAYVDGGAPKVWTRLSSGQWQNVGSGLPSSGSFEAAQLADMDGDGDVDLVALGNGRMRVWLNAGGASTWTLDTQLTLPSPGYYSSISRPVDVDHNGRPDVALVTESGGRNHPHVARETSVASALGVTARTPRGGAVHLVGSVRSIEWLAAVPAADAGATVDLELSVTGRDGEWMPVASGLPNNGHYQWTVPTFAPSDSCYIRYTVHGASSGVVVAISPVAFAIHGGPTAAQEAAHDRASVRVTPSATRGTMRIDVPEGVRSITVHDARGALVRTLDVSPSLAWDGCDARGARVASGVYVVRAGARTARVVRWK